MKYAILDSRAVYDFDRALVHEVCRSIKEAKRRAPEYGDGCCVYEIRDGQPWVFVWQHGQASR